MSSWENKWYGFWSEDGEEYSSAPSINNYVDKKNYEDVEKVLSYLSSGTLVCAANFIYKCPICGEELQGSKAMFTDGNWVWPGDLQHHVQYHNLWIPTEFLDWMISNNFKVDPEVKFDPKTLDWP